jgi:hypothetical protein
MGSEKLGRIVLVEKTLPESTVFWWKLLCRVKRGRTPSGGTWCLRKEYNPKSNAIRERILDNTGSGMFIEASFFNDGKDRFRWKSSGTVGGAYFTSMDWEKYKRWKREITGL